MGRHNPYDLSYRRQRKALLAESPSCVWCGEPATTADHVPPLEVFRDAREWEGQLVPACRRCNYGRRAMRAYKATVAAVPGVRRW